MNLLARLAPHEEYWYFYEELRDDSRCQFFRLIRQINMPYNEHAFCRALRESSFERMREAEEKGIWDDARLQPGRRGDSDSFKVRRGKVGGFRDYFNEEDYAFAQCVLESLDPPLRRKYCSSRTLPQ